MNCKCARHVYQFVQLPKRLMFKLKDFTSTIHIPPIYEYLWVIFLINESSVRQLFNITKSYSVFET